MERASRPPAGGVCFPFRRRTVLKLLLTNVRLTLAGTALFAFALLCYADPAWAKAAGVDVWSIRELNDELASGTARRQELDIHDEVIQRRIALKEGIVGDLLAGRLSLAEATSQFAALNLPRADAMAVIRATYPGRTDEEKLARNVIEYARLRVDDKTPPGVMARLEAEFDRLARPAATTVH